MTKEQAISLYKEVDAKLQSQGNLVDARLLEKAIQLTYLLKNEYGVDVRTL